jgi:glycosyltransferase involved in cell wall biosynthesis
VGVVALRRLVPRRWRPAVAVELGGDWRTATRLYGSRRRRLVAPAADRVAAWAVRNADLVRAVSGFTEELARDAGFRGEVVRFSGYTDLEVFLAPPTVAPPDTPTAIYVGAFEPTKGTDVLVEAWPAVRDAVPDARLVLVGSGRLESQLRARVQALSVSSTVTFAGRRPPAVVGGLLDRSTLLVLPSRSEGLGLVLREAAARARPLVGSNTGGIAEQTVDGVTGVLVPPENAGALATALIELLGDLPGAARMGKQAYDLLVAGDPVGNYERQIAAFGRWVEEYGRGRR